MRNLVSADFADLHRWISREDREGSEVEKYFSFAVVAAFARHSLCASAKIGGICG
jgi:hypothetical protein